METSPMTQGDVFRLMNCMHTKTNMWENTTKKVFPSKGSTFALMMITGTNLYTWCGRACKVNSDGCKRGWEFFRIKSQLQNVLNLFQIACTSHLLHILLFLAYIHFWGEMQSMKWKCLLKNKSKAERSMEWNWYREWNSIVCNAITKV